MSVFYFCWVDYTTGGVPAFGPEHQVEDEKIVSFKVEHKEGDCATCSIDVRNQKIGLLAPGRPLWAYLSYDSGTGGVVPIFFGRLVGVPTNILSEVVTLQLTAKPLDFTAQKFALCETLKVLPWYDPLFVDPKLRPYISTDGQQIGDADVVLEAYSKLWHIDRLSLVLTVSDILLGEDGVERFSDAEVPYDSVAIEIGQAPLNLGPCFHDGGLVAGGHRADRFRFALVSMLDRIIHRIIMAQDRAAIGRRLVGGGRLCHRHVECRRACRLFRSNTTTRIKPRPTPSAM